MADKIKTEINILVCGISSLLFGGFDSLITILLVLITMDFISGFITAWVKGQVSSKSFYNGGIKKSGIMVIVSVATQLDQILGSDTELLRTAAISYYIANEGLSILENWGKLGLPLPKVIKNALANIKKDK